MINLNLVKYINKSCLKNTLLRISNDPNKVCNYKLHTFVLHFKPKRAPTDASLRRCSSK